MSYPPPVKRLIDEYADRRPMRSTSLIITLFGDTVSQHGHTLWLGSLIEALAPLGVNERLVRTSVFRLVKEGWLEYERVGRRSFYQFTNYGRHEYERATRRIYAAQGTTWKGRWQLLVPLNIREDYKEGFRRSLFWQGFRNINGGTFAKPGDGGTELREMLNEFDASDKVLLFEASTTDISSGRLVRDMVHECWNLTEVASGYGEFLERFKPLLKLVEKGEALSPQDAFVMRTLLIHDYRRLLLKDTELPEELLPSGWPGKAAREMSAKLYGALAKASSEFVAENLQGDNDKLPPAIASYWTRFGAS